MRDLIPDKPKGDDFFRVIVRLVLLGFGAWVVIGAMY
jgi:hypothetical protein